ncbi:MAG: transcription initiation factor IIB family protein [Promethearchaeota archaeon]
MVNSLERNLWEAKPKLRLLASKLNIPDFIKETAWRIYCEAAKNKLTMGRTIDGFIAASLYAAIRIHEFPRLLEDLVDASMTPKHTIFRSLGLIIKEILPALDLKYHPITVKQLVYRFGYELGLPMNVQKNAIDMLLSSSNNKSKWIGKDPKGLAASVLYLAAKNNNFKKTQKQVAEVANITEVTLRTRLKEIKHMR